ncbi:MAG: MXAN_5187 C-terminal domain-containing protein [Terriglobia bacterium]
MTIDEQLASLEDNLRRLKIEYDIFFNGGSPRPPNDTLWRVDSLIKRLADTPQMNFPQRFRYNGMAARYALYNQMWQQRIRSREEGPRKSAAEAREAQKKAPAFQIQWNDAAAEPDKVNKLFSALVEAKRKLGENADNLGEDAFRRFVQQKTEQLKRDFRCQQVEYVVEVENGQVRLRAKGV